MILKQKNKRADHFSFCTELQNNGVKQTKVSGRLFSSLTISDHLVQLWAENSVQGLLWEGSRCPPATLRLRRHLGTVCQGPNVQTSCGNTQRHTKTNNDTHACLHIHTNTQKSNNHPKKQQKTDLEYDHEYRLQVRTCLLSQQPMECNQTQQCMITAP